jgi:hypothetical protein
VPPPRGGVASSTRRSPCGAERLDLGTELTHEVFAVDLLVGEPLSTVVVLDLSRGVRDGELRTDTTSGGPGHLFEHVIVDDVHAGAGLGGDQGVSDDGELIVLISLS